MVAEEAIPSVIVSEPAAANLADHLHKQGRLRGGVRTVIDTLNKAVTRKWETQTEIFHDPEPGWIIDVSNYFDDEMLYAIVRSDGGNRAVVAIVDEDELGEFKKTRQWKTPEARAGGLSEAIEVTGDDAANVQALPQRRPPWVPPAESKPTDPRLIVWWEPIEGGGSDEKWKSPQIEETTYGAAQGKVMPLLMRGCRVEVWSGLKKPALKVDI